MNIKIVGRAREGNAGKGFLHGRASAAADVTSPLSSIERLQ